MPKIADKPKPNRPLTGPQAAFCRAYATSENGTAAYREAYPDSTYDAARSSAPDLLAKPCIQAEIARLREIPDNAVKLTIADKHRILHELATDKGLEPRDRIAAIMADGKYAGDFAVEKQELTLTYERPEDAVARAQAAGIDVAKLLGRK